MDASTTAMAAINTVVAVSTVVLAVLGLAVAAIAIFGWTAMRTAAVEQAKKIANQKLDSYMKSEEFEVLAFDLIQRAVDKRWQNTVVVQTFQSTERPQGEANAFPAPPEKTP